MNPLSHRHAAYWRNTLADAELGKGAFTSADADAFLAVPLEQIFSDRISGPPLNALFAREPRAAAEVRVVLRPYVYRAV